MVKGYTKPVTIFRPEVTRASDHTESAPRRHNDPTTRESDDPDNPTDTTAAPPLRRAFRDRSRSLTINIRRAAAVGVATYGRVREMAVLRGAIGLLALELGGGVVTIQGMPGIGKSHLAATTQVCCDDAEMGVTDLFSEVGQPAQGERDGAAHTLAVWRPILLDALRLHLGLLPRELLGLRFHLHLHHLRLTARLLHLRPGRLLRLTPRLVRVRVRVRLP